MASIELADEKTKFWLSIVI